MARSVKKGKFFFLKNLKLIKNNKIFYKKNLWLTKNLWNKRILLYNGKSFNKLKVKYNFFYFYLKSGNFVFTRKYFLHRRAKDRKKREKEARLALLALRKANKKKEFKRK